jgi:rRNA processing protein Gar1
MKSIINFFKKIFSTTTTTSSSTIIIKSNIGGNINVGVSAPYSKKISSFQEIENNTAFDVNIIENDSSNKNKIDYLIPEKYSKSITFQIKNNKLTIGTIGNIIGSFSSSITIYTSIKNINKIKNTSVGKMIVNGTLAEKEISIFSTSTGNVAIENITCENLEVYNSGVGRILFVTGSVDNSYFEITSTGDIDASEVESQNINVNSSGIGKLKAKVVNKATGSLTSIGDALIYGQPESVLIESNSIGSVKFNKG